MDEIGRQVLTEEEYEKAASAIIKRDYFPLAARLDELTEGVALVPGQRLNEFQKSFTTEDDYSASRLLDSDKAQLTRARFAALKASAEHNEEQIARRKSKSSGMILHLHKSENQLMFGVRANEHKLKSIFNSDGSQGEGARLGALIQGKPPLPGELPRSDQNNQLAVRKTMGIELESERYILDQLHQPERTLIRYNQTDLKADELDDDDLNRERTDQVLEGIAAERKREELAEAQIRSGKFTKELDTRILELTQGLTNYSMQEIPNEDKLARSLRLSTVKKAQQKSDLKKTRYGTIDSSVSAGGVSKSGSLLLNSQLGRLLKKKLRRG